MFGGFFVKNSHLITAKICRSDMNITTTIKWKIFGCLLRNRLQSSDILGSLRKSSEIIGNCREMAYTPWYTKQNNLDFLPSFFSSWKKFNVTVNFLLLVLKCLKFNCFRLLEGYGAKKISVIEVPPFSPSFFSVSCRRHLELHQVWMKAESLLFVLK